MWILRRANVTKDTRRDMREPKSDSKRNVAKERVREMMKKGNGGEGRIEEVSKAKSTDEENGME